MSDQINPARHRANLVGCVLIALVCIPASVSLGLDLASLPAERPDDPDAGKGAAIYWFGFATCGLLGLVAAISGWRSLRSLRRGDRSAP